MVQEPTVKVREAEDPRSGEWVVEWRSPLIAGPSYLYFPTEEKAQEAAARILQHKAASPVSESADSGADAPAEPSAQPPILQVVSAGKRLLAELPQDVCAEAAADLRDAIERLEREVEQ